MSYLSACSVYSGYDSALADDSSAYACAECDHDYILMALSATLPHFSERCYIGIISGFYGNACQVFQFFIYIENTPAEVDTLQYCSVILYRSRHSHAYALDVTHLDAVLLVIFLDGCCNIRQDELA